MLFRRRKTIFHVEESLPDPEEIKLRFRRRIMIFSFLGAVGILTVPVFNELEDSLRLKKELRKISDFILESKRLAAQTRLPIVLTLSQEGKNWSRILSSKSDICEKESKADQGGLETIYSWGLNLKNELGDTIRGDSICFHPTKGVLVGDSILGESQLLLSARIGDQSFGNPKAAYILMSQFGDEIQFTDSL